MTHSRTRSGAAPTHSISSFPTELYSEILPGLWQGGTADSDTIDNPVTKRAMWNTPRDVTVGQFQSVVTLYAWARPADWWVTEYRYPFMDSGEDQDWAAIEAAADWAYARWQAGDKVLIRCQAGVSRSGLVTALVLMRHGFEAHDAIKLLRLRRADVVLRTNPSFIKYLLRRGR